MVLIINFNIYHSYLKAFEKLVLRTSFSVPITKKRNFHSNFPPHQIDHLACWTPRAPVWGWALGSSTVAAARARAHTQHSTLILGLL